MIWKATKPRVKNYIVPRKKYILRNIFATLVLMTFFSSCSHDLARESQIVEESYSDYSPGWFLYEQYKSKYTQYRLYINKESMQRTEEGTIRVWYRAVYPGSAVNIKLIEEELREIDCSHSRYRILERKYIKKWGLDPIQESSNAGIATDWLSDAHRGLYGVVCGKGEKR
jgi:hypothetical protein